VEIEIPENASVACFSVERAGRYICSTYDISLIKIMNVHHNRCSKQNAGSFFERKFRQYSLSFKNNCP